MQEEGLAIGTPTSSIFSKTYPQHIKNKKIVDILFKNHVTGYSHSIQKRQNKHI
jgi:hypothetical protein